MIRRHHCIQKKYIYISCSVYPPVLVVHGMWLIIKCTIFHCVVIWYTISHCSILVHYISLCNNLGCTISHCVIIWGHISLCGNLVHFISVCSNPCMYFLGVLRLCSSLLFWVGSMVASTNLSISVSASVTLTSGENC